METYLTSEFIDIDFKKFYKKVYKKTFIVNMFYKKIFFLYNFI